MTASQVLGIFTGPQPLCRLGRQPSGKEGGFGRLGCPLRVSNFEHGRRDPNGDPETDEEQMQEDVLASVAVAHRQNTHVQSTYFRKGPTQKQPNVRFASGT